MKKYFVYEIYNELGIPFYVGCTHNLTRRKSEHIRNGRIGTYNVVKEFTEDKLDVALYYEAYLKYVHGLNDYIKPETTTYSTKVKGGKASSQQLVKLQKENYSQPVKVYTKSGQFVGQYPSQIESIREMSKLLGRKLDYRFVYRVLNGKDKSAYGYIFKRA